MAGTIVNARSIKDISGEVNIVGSHIYTRHTSNQLSALFAQLASSGRVLEQ